MASSKLEAGGGYTVASVIPLEWDGWNGDEESSTLLSSSLRSLEDSQKHFTFVERIRLQNLPELGELIAVKLQFEFPHLSGEDTVDDVLSLLRNLPMEGLIIIRTGLLLRA